MDLGFEYTHAGHIDWHVALDRALARLKAPLAAHAGEYTLGWCYLTDFHARDAEAILATLQQRLPGVAWVGTVGVGVCASGIEYFDEPGLALMLAPLPREAFRLFSGRAPLHAHEPDFTAHTALVHAEGTTPDMQELIRELAARTTTGYLFGGLASARTRTLHISDAVLTGGVSGVAFSAAVGVISRVTQGCQPIGVQHRVTQAQGNYAIRLDGRPALECALDDLGLARDAPIDTVVAALSDTLAGLQRAGEDLPHPPGQFGPDTVVRHVVGMDPAQGVLAIGDWVDPDARLTFCARNPEAARADLRRIATEIRELLDADPGMRAGGAVYVSCSGRGGPHFGAPHAELQTVREALGELPLVGFFAAGEIARDRLYGYTGVLTVFTVPA